MSESYKFFYFAGETWVLGFIFAFVLFIASYIFISWNKCSTWVKRYLVHKGTFDYKDIFKHYLQHINSIEDKRSLYRAMLQVICDIVGSHDASLLLKDNGEYVVKESFGSKPASFQVGDISIFLKWLTKFGHTVSRYQLVNRKEFAKIKGEGLQYCVQFHAEACVPLFIRGELLGVINIGSRASGELYDGPTRELLDILGGQSSVAIHNASLYEDTVRRNIQLQEVARLKSQLLSNVSHEFRTPLNSIIGLTEIIMDGGDGPVTNEQREHLKMVALSGSRLLETVSSMVDLAKLEANHLSLNVRRLNLTKMVSKVADGLSKTKDTSFKLSLNKETPPIYGDEGWLEKLFSHVLNNAVKYTPNGEIIIDAEKSGEMLKVGVHDTGVGIALERQNEIFDSFVQGNGGVERPFEGSGMGLAISKKVIELHGGRIWLTSSPGKGAHFFFTLPLKPTSVKSVELKQ